MKFDRQLLLGFYGDDFTGSTDSMEALTLNGIKTVLFLEPPSPELLEQRFKDIQAFGIAGISRSLCPDEMEKELPSIFRAFRSFNIPVIHYKICSTFDSAPHIGSIGKAIDIISEILPNERFIPLVVGAPLLKRYTIFGNHFATVGEATHRLDRHPAMSRHPVTPMCEADLRIHLGKQTTKKIELMNIFELADDIDRVRKKLESKLESKPDILLFDVLDEERLGKVGRLIWEEAECGNVFVVGSSGVQYALTSYWRTNGEILKIPISLESPGAVKQLLVISGSCSPVTNRQIEYAFDRGYAGIQIPLEKLLESEQREHTTSELIMNVQNVINEGKSVILYTALGPEDKSIEKTKQILGFSGLNPLDSGSILGQQLGKICKELVLHTGLRRVLVAGGDTSGYVTKELGLYALEVIIPVAPGGPLCRGFSNDPRLDGIELSLKGGQVGKEDYFIKVQNGECM